jgi:hypothetical protein
MNQRVDRYQRYSYVVDLSTTVSAPGYELRSENNTRHTQNICNQSILKSWYKFSFPESK